MSKKISSIYIAKALSIIVIVVGHFTPENAPAYWEDVRKILSCSNMALFFFLSGYLLNYSKISLSNYYSFLKNKISKVLIPALLFSAIILIIKITIQDYFNLQNPVTLRSVLQMIVNPPDGGFYPLIWFIYTLFLLFITFPLLKEIIPNEKIILGISIITFFIKLPEIFCINHLFHFLPAFTLGYIIGKKFIPDNFIIKDTLKILFTSIIVFVAGVYLKFIGLENPILIKMNLLILQFSGIIIYLCLAVMLKDLLFVKKLKLIEIGRNTLVIYFLHTFFVGSIRIIFKDFTYTYFELIMILATISGIYIPIFLKLVLLQKYRITKKYLLGEV